MEANEWIEKIRDPDYEVVVERVFVIQAKAFDWNRQ